MVLARNGYRRHATFAIEGKVDGTFGPLVKDWLGSAPSQGKRLRLAYLAELVALDELQLGGIRYQLLHRTASAKIEAARNGSEVAAMLVRRLGFERRRSRGFFSLRFSHGGGSIGREGGLLGRRECLAGVGPRNPRYLMSCFNCLS